MRLGLEVARGNDEVLLGDGKLVEHEVVRRANIGDEEFGPRLVGEWVKWFGRGVFRGAFRFASESWREA